MDDDPTRNKPWSRDELILALDLYFRIQPRTPDPKLPEIKELSLLLKSMHHEQTDNNFRSVASVVMKLMNFRNLDPAYDGKGLAGVGKSDRLVWQELAGDRRTVSELATAIRRAQPVVSATTAAPAGDRPVKDQEK